MEIISSSVFFRYIFPPLFYGFHGWIATKMAIWALFHPYEPWFISYWPGKRIQIPGTPGIFPKRRAKLAQAVAATITDTLLTAEDIRMQAEVLVTKQNLFIAVDAFVDSVLKEFRDTSKLHRLAADLSELSPAVLEHLVVSIIDGVQKGTDSRVANITEKIFDQLIFSARISPDQANSISTMLMDSVLTSSKMRSALITLLSQQNINAIDESVQAHASAPYRILARIIGVKRVCNEWKNFFEKQPEEAEKIIADLITRFELQKQIANQIVSFDLRSMPLQQISTLKASLVGFVQTYLLEHKRDILEVVTRLEGEAMGTVRAAIVQFTPSSIPEHWLLRAKQDISDFCHQYLQAELGQLLEKAIPALGMYELIARKIDLFSSKELEKLINRLCEQELNLLALLGLFIGVWMGLVQVFVNMVFR